MSRPRAGIDIDGVLYRWSDTARFLFKHYWGLGGLDESTSWSYLQDNVPPEAWKWLWTDGVEKHGLFRHGNCFPGSFEALHLLRDLGLDLVLITSRPMNARADTYAWIDYHRIQPKEVHVIGHTDWKSKIEPLCDWYVDDKPENIADLETTGRPAFLFDRPWNQNATPARRVYSWNSIIAEVTK